MSRIGWSDFVIWQCNLRQRNFRIFNGKPSEGTSAVLIDPKNKLEIANIKTVLIEKNCLNTTKMFKFMLKKTHDPLERFNKAVNFFSSEYYTDSKNFDGTFSATFPSNSNLVKYILKKRKCNIEFFEKETGFNFSVKAYKLKKNDPKWVYTFLHNSFFNSKLSSNIDIVCFIPEKIKIKKI